MYEPIEREHIINYLINSKGYGELDFEDVTTEELRAEYLATDLDVADVANYNNLVML